MKKEKAKEIDYSQDHLPVSRKAQFKDILKKDYSLLLRLGSVFFLFTIPLFALLLLMNFFGESLVEGGATPMTYFLNDLIFDAGLLISAIVMAIGIAGCDRIWRLICWDEPVIFWSDFKEGVRLNYKNDLLISVIFALILSFVNISSDIFTLINNTNGVGIVVFAILSGIVVFFFLPITMTCLAYNSYYKERFGKLISNSAKATMYSYLPLIVFVLPIVLLVVLYLFTDSIYLIVYAFAVIFLGPIYSLGWRLYILSVFDYHINVNYEGYYKKGLYQGGTANEEN